MGETIEINNFAFEVKVILGLESTILDGRPDGEAGNRTSTAQLGLGLGLSLAISPILQLMRTHIGLKHVLLLT